MSKLINNLAAAAKITKQKQQRLYHTIKLQHGTVYMFWGIQALGSLSGADPGGAHPARAPPPPPP